MVMVEAILMVVVMVSMGAIEFMKYKLIGLGPRHKTCHVGA